jgi:signal transduction histidine kinase
VIPNLRIRLTALYGGIFVVFAALLLLASYWLMARHLDRTLLPDDAAASLAQLRVRYLLALAGATLVATALGWYFAGRELGSMARALEARERFVANASHELRSPLTVIRTEADVTLADPHASVGELRAMGEEVIVAADQMDGLLDGLMVLALSERPQREPLDLASAVGAAARTVRSEDVRVRLDLGSAAVRGERRMLERLAANLIENGVRYNAPGGYVAVSTRVHEGGGAVLDVVNSGPHVDPAVAERLTEPFERGGRAHDGGGAGLGLSIVRSVAEAHGGRMTLTPRREGGLAVRVTLPA